MGGMGGGVNPMLPLGYMYRASDACYLYGVRLGRVSVAFERKRRAGPCREHLRINLGQPLATIHARGVDGGVTATGVLSRQRGNLITIVNTR